MREWATGLFDHFRGEGALIREGGLNGKTSTGIGKETVVRRIQINGFSAADGMLRRPAFELTRS
jgi:hypothetical protein